MGPEDLEEHFLLRIEDPAVADKLRKALREEEELSSGVELIFDGPGREGKFVLDGEEYPVSLLDLPTVVESYKTLDDINLVKITDIGQMLLVRRAGTDPPANTESEHGLTPAFRDARRRWFRPAMASDPQLIAKVEQALLAILKGHAPEKMMFQDFEEEYVVDPVTKIGSWQQVSK